MAHFDLEVAQRSDYMRPEFPLSSSVVKSDSPSALSVWIRRTLSILAFGLVLYLFWPLLAELRNVLDLFKHAQWVGLAIAIGIEFISYACLTQLNYLLLSPFAGKIGFWRLMAILPTTAFIEVALPSAGLSGVVLRARLLGKSGYSAEASSFTMIIESIYIAGVMAVLSLAGVWYLLDHGDMSFTQLSILIMIMLLLAGVCVLLYRLGRDKQRAVRGVSWFVTRWNHVLQALHQASIPVENLRERIDRFYEGIGQLNHVSPILLLTAASGRIVLDVGTLWLCFLAFHFTVSLGILLTGYGLVLTFSGLAALPGGLGLVDISLAVIFAKLGAPGAVAVAAALSYRIIAFWLVRFIGFVSWQVLEVRG